jgi:hypothetical protein
MGNLNAFRVFIVTLYFHIKISFQMHNNTVINTDMRSCNFP